MLGSITPLGERGRKSRWGLTIVAFIVASTMAGALLGGALGGVGALLGVGPSAGTLAVLAALLLAGLALDLGLAGLRLPSVDRQVDDRWLYRYRGWVTGIGFGFQLGLGVVTIVTTAATYVTFAAALLSGSPAAGALIGGAYGLIRASTILGGWAVDSPERLIALQDRLTRWDSGARLGSVVAQAGLVAMALALTVQHA